MVPFQVNGGGEVAVEEALEKSKSNVQSEKNVDSGGRCGAVISKNLSSRFFGAGTVVVSGAEALMKAPGKRGRG